MSPQLPVLDPQAQLLRAAQGGEASEAEVALARGANPNASVQQKTVLQWAVYLSHEQVVNVLLNAGADPNVLNARGANALHEVAVYAAAHEDEAGVERASRIAQALLDHGAHPDVHTAKDMAQRDGQKTAAHTLAGTRHGHAALQKVLQKYPHLVDAVDERGQTPLAVAVLEYNVHNLDVLLSMGSDPFAKSPRGETVMSLTKRLQPQWVERMNVEMVNRERAALLPLTEGVASIAPPRPKTRL